MTIVGMQAFTVAPRPAGTETPWLLLRHIDLGIPDKPSEDITWTGLKALDH